ncbi:GIY-YIG nuclease family protein [Novisyntrophococcus fermenticellae]|uniref:GIY-YIG nuclease family protein n=1 Tax=Novisyntrophococcus fermenticellae TaxID=2068655 RepID=UPI001E608D9C|nr:GIY-YIG nuclease family protein [Novisyntrophococcus fermenticellae]
MDRKRKKELIEEYQNRRPEMGIICFRSLTTEETFLGGSNDTKAGFNSNRFKLNANGHPNKRLQELWNQYGEDAFELSVMQVLKYEDPKADHSEELEKLLIQCLETSNNARRIWR